MASSDSEQPEEVSEEEAKVLMDIDAWIEKLRHSDRSLYNLMALEVWSIAKTMDSLIPGFWTRFMANRQVALKQFMQQQKKQASSGNGATSPEPRNPATDTDPPPSDL